MARRAQERMEEAVAAREGKGLLRKLSSRSWNNNVLVDFCSNDYLGMSRSADLKEEVKKELAIAEEMLRKEGGSVQGSTGSRLLSGNNSYVESIEKHIANFHNREAALLFNTGYTANMGVVSSVPMKGDIVVYDSLCHNSILEGFKLGRQKDTIQFKHNDVDNLRDILEAQHEKTTGCIFVVVESVYSMEGDVGRLKEFCTLMERFPKSCLIVDEAHGTGLYGEGGRGVLNEQGLEGHPSILCSVHTYGKAFGVHGAGVLGPAVLKSYLLNYARSIIFTTSLSLHALASIRAAYTVIEAAEGRRAHLMHLIKVFTETLKTSLPPSRLFTSPSPIQAVIVHGNKEVIAAAASLRNQGYDVLPIRAPTVQAGLERLRVILHSHNSTEEVLHLASLIKNICANNIAKL